VFLILVSCNEVPLVPLEEKATKPFKTSADICSLPALSSHDKVKLLFIVDMSASNVQDNPSGSDIPGDRIKHIKSFLEQECLSKNAASRIAVFGFANEVLPAATACTESNFVTFDKVSSQVTALEEIDAKTRADCLSRSPSGNCTQFTTDYIKGIECAKNIVQNDIETPDPDGKRAFYMIFFLTDGEPLDGVKTFEQFKSQSDSLIKQMKTKAENKALGLQFQPIFYGGQYLATKDPSGVKQALADEILTEMATVGLTEYVKLEEINDVNFCALMESGTTIPYGVKTFVATNLTAVKLGQQIYPDSDADGIADHIEAERGFNPATPRSMAPESHLIDGACGGLNADLCLNPAYQDCGVPNAIGITECEVRKLGLINGLDSDPVPDGFLDIMELVKGTPLNDSSGIDDGDALTEFEELMIGRDPNVPDDETPNDLKVIFQRSLLQAPLENCPNAQESIRFKIDQIPLVQTIATEASDSVSIQIPWLQHDTGDNIILMYYILTPKNQDLRDELKDQVYGQFVTVNYWQNNVNIGGFEKLGEVTPGFEEADRRK
ncbi:MAG: hypothetical protein ACE5FU_12535, partial [Nitrospinota bacterium]